jgi:hypothetical protein
MLVGGGNGSSSPFIAPDEWKISLISIVSSGPYLWSVRWIFIHDLAVAKFLHQGLFALDVGKRQGSNFLRIELCPLFSAHLHVRTKPRVYFEGKSDDGLGIDEIDKGVSDVAAVLEIHAQVKEVVFALVRLINHIHEHLLTS